MYMYKIKCSFRSWEFFCIPCCFLFNNFSLLLPFLVLFCFLKVYFKKALCIVMNTVVDSNGTVMKTEL